MLRSFATLVATVAIATMTTVASSTRKEKRVMDNNMKLAILKNAVETVVEILEYTIVESPNVERILTEALERIKDSCHAASSK